MFAMYKPDQIFVDQEAVDLPFAQKILNKFPEVEQHIVERFEWKIFFPDDGKHKLTQGKRVLHLKAYRGAAVKACPAFTDGLVCCDLQVLDFIENCPLECTYCILQAYLNKPVMTMHVNVEEIIEKTIQTIEARPERHFRVGTGEHSDSLALDHILDMNPYLVETFGKISNATLELKTKTNSIEPLLGLKHNGNTVISWSISPSEAVKQFEYKTASTVERIEAAQRVIEDGYRAGFHFDPIIHYDGWQEGYRELIRMIFQNLPHDRIAWVSFGTLRYLPELKRIAEERFPNLSIFADEFVSTQDGKMKYIKPIREELLGTISNWVRQVAPTVPNYLCMEQSGVWNKTMDYRPKNIQEFEDVLTPQAK